MESRYSKSLNCRILEFSKTYTFDFTCYYDLKMYPFDKQFCHLDLALHEDTDDYFEMEPRDLFYAEVEQYSINQYNVKILGFEKVPNSKGTTVTIKIELKRQFIYIFLTTILPAILINVVSSTSFPLKFF